MNLSVKKWFGMKNPSPRSDLSTELGIPRLEPLPLRVRPSTLPPMSDRPSIFTVHYDLSGLAIVELETIAERAPLGRKEELPQNRRELPLDPRTLF
jgi:hypothetical protein